MFCNFEHMANFVADNRKNQLLLNVQLIAFLSTTIGTFNTSSPVIHLIIKKSSTTLTTGLCALETREDRKVSLIELLEFWASQTGNGRAQYVGDWCESIAKSAQEAVQLVD